MELKFPAFSHRGTVFGATPQSAATSAGGSSVFVSEPRMLMGTPRCVVTCGHVAVRSNAASRQSTTRPHEGLLSAHVHDPRPFVHYLVPSCRAVLLSCSGPACLRNVHLPTNR